MSCSRSPSRKMRQRVSPVLPIENVMVKVVSKEATDITENVCVGGEKLFGFASPRTLTLHSRTRDG